MAYIEAKTVYGSNGSNLDKVLAEPVRVSDMKITNTSANTVATLTPTVQRNYSVKVYYRVVTGTTTVTITITYTDGSGTQTLTLVNGTSQAVGVYTLNSVFINALTTAPITVSTTAGTVNQVYVSASIIPE